jgi:hypothetical protein
MENVQSYTQNDIARHLTSVGGGLAAKFNNGTFNVLLAEEAPWVIYDSAVKCAGAGYCKEQFTGICKDLLEQLQNESSGGFKWKPNQLSRFGTTENEIVTELESTSLTPSNELMCGGLPVSEHALLRNVDYTLPFWSTEIVFIHSKTTSTAPLDIATLTSRYYKICMRTNSTLLHEIKLKYTKSDLIEIDTLDDMEQHLLSGQCDVALETRTVAEYLVGKSTGCMLELKSKAIGQNLPELQEVSLALRENMGGDAHEISHLISQLQQSVFFSEIQTKFSTASCSPLSDANFGSPYPILEILTVTNPPFVYYSEKVNQKLLAKLATFESAKERSDFLDTSEGLDLANSRFSGFIVDMVSSGQLYAHVDVSLLLLQLSIPKLCDGMRLTLIFLVLV